MRILGCVYLLLRNIQFISKFPDTTPIPDKHVDLQKFEMNLEKMWLLDILQSQSYSIIQKMEILEHFGFNCADIQYMRGLDDW